MNKTIEECLNDSEIQSRISKIKDLIIGESAGVLQASDLLEKAVQKIKTAVKNHEFELASKIGYDQLSQEFIFLQRALGGLHSAELEKQKLISDIAFIIRTSYEEIAPHIEKILK